MEKTEQKKEHSLTDGLPQGKEPERWLEESKKQALKRSLCSEAGFWWAQTEESPLEAF